MKRLALILFLMTAGPVFAGEGQWHWAYAQNCSNRWNLWKGLADVEIQGTKFQAKLYDEKNPKDVDIILKGTIKAGKIKVVETEMNTDVGESDFSGTYLSEKNKSDPSAKAFESINLSDGYSMIGLTREIQN